MAASPGGVEVGRISVRVVPDTSKFGASLKAKLDTIEKRLGDLNIRVTADTTDFTAPLEKTRQEQERNPISIPVKAPTDAMAASIRAEALKLSKSVQVDIPITTEGERLRQEIAAQVAVIESLTKIEIPVDLENAAILRNKMALELDLLKSMAARANPTVDIHTEVDTGSLAKADAEIAAASSASEGLASGLSGISSAAIVLGPALIPIGAALAGLAAALVAPIAIVGGGLTLFGVIAGFTIAQTSKQLKAISDLQTKLAGLKRGTQEYADTAKELRAQQSALTPAQVAFGRAVDGVKSVFNSIPKAIVLKPVTEGLHLLADVIPLVTPILRTVSGVISDMMTQLDAGAKSQGFKDFVTAFAKNLGPDLRAFGTIAGNIFHGLFGLFGAFNSQLSGSVLKSLEHLTGKFAKWGETVGQSKGFKAFVDYIKQVGPKVAQTLGDVAGALVDIVTAAAPLGTAVLTALDGVARAIGKIPTPILTALVTFFTLVAGLGLGPVVAGIATAFIALYQNSKPLRKVLGDLGDFFKTELLPIIKKAADQILPSLKAAFHDISQTIRDNKPFLEIMGKLLLVFASAVVVTAILAIVVAIRLVGKAVQFIIPFWHGLADIVLVSIAVILRVVAFLVGSLLKGFGAIVHGAALAFGWIPGLGGKIKGADAAFQSFTSNVIDNINGAADAVDGFRHKLDDALHPPKPIKITVDDLRAVQQLEALQKFRLSDKNLTITTSFIERVVGPGGGIGQPSKNNANGITPTPPPSTGGPTRNATSGHGGPGPLVQVDRLEVRDVNDLLRKAGNLHRSRAGGGVTLVGAR